MKVNVVGCGLSGITAARLLTDAGHECRIFDSRKHIGGNCYDSNVCGVMVHNYGPHVFHTDDERVFEFLSRFTEWTPFKLQPKGNTRLGLVSLPYSRKTVAEIGRELSQEEIIEYMFREYSEKQWGVPFDQIPASITNRIPKTKDCDDPTWFEGQKYQCIPRNGYTKMFEAMLEGIPVELGCASDEWKKHSTDLTVYTGKVDEYFNFRFGVLPYRSLRFVHKVTSERMPFCIQNENNRTNDYTRKYDHGYFTANHEGLTVITEEYPQTCGNEDVPFYPIPFGEGLKVYMEYKKLADAERKTIFLGRLATYTYLDMWMAVKQVMIRVDRILS
jgi:UDP-galactopyranose mutase